MHTFQNQSIDAFRKLLMPVPKNFFRGLRHHCFKVAKLQDNVVQEVRSLKVYGHL